MLLVEKKNEHICFPDLVSHISGSVIIGSNPWRTQLYFSGNTRAEEEVNIRRDLRLEKNPSNSEHIISEHRLFRADNYFSEQEYFFRARIFFSEHIFKNIFFPNTFFKNNFFKKGCRKIRAIPSKLFPSTDISEQVFIFPSRYLFSEQEIIFRAGIYFSEQIIIFLA